MGLEMSLDLQGRNPDTTDFKQIVTSTYIIKIILFILTEHVSRIEPVVAQESLFGLFMLQIVAKPYRIGTDHENSLLSLQHFSTLNIHNLCFHKRSHFSDAPRRLFPR